MTQDELAARLEQLGLSLPKPIAPIANYVPYVVTGNQLFISGQVSITAAGDFLQGQIGSDDGISMDLAVEAAKWCAVNILAQACVALDGSLDRISRCVRLNGFVNSTPDFRQHPQVINGASDTMVDVLGDKGRHSRIAVGVSSLPLNAAVEIDAIFEVQV